jgi:hypothetical protein
LAQAPARPRDLKPTMPDAPKILLSNVYGWFDRVERGIYKLSDAGQSALVQWKAHLPTEANTRAGGHNSVLDNAGTSFS